jgi:hypothetical protein
MESERDNVAGIVIGAHQGAEELVGRRTTAAAFRGIELEHGHFFLTAFDGKSSHIGERLVYG